MDKSNSAMPVISAHATAQGVNSQSLSVMTIVEDCIARAKNLGPTLNCFTYFDEAFIRERASHQEVFIKGALAEGRMLPLAGVPIALKDNISTRGIPTTCASKMLSNYRPIFDATVVERLQQAGAIFFGKTNMDEFGMGTSCENSAFGPVLNPWDLGRVAGGSSGGSAAVLASGLAPLALGSDTGGSVRTPASFCGVVGYKPSYGTVSRYGLVAYASSLDQIGPMARSAKDAALLYDVISGHDPKDSTSQPNAKSLEPRKNGIEGLRIGRISEFFGEGLSPAVHAAIDQATLELERAVAKIVELTLPELLECVPVYYIIACAEASANLARFDGVRYGYRASGTGDSVMDLYLKSRSEGFGQEVKQRIMLGTYVLSSGYYDAYYNKATQLRQKLTQDIAQAFTNVDFLIAPTFATTAFPLGEKTRDPLAMYLSDLYTIAVNLAGIPAVSLPCGYDASGLPIGVQFWGAQYQDRELLAFAQRFEDAFAFDQGRRPKLS